MNIKFQKAQAAFEYMILFAVVAAIVIVAMRTILPKTQVSSEGYFNSVTNVIMGDNPNPIDGKWCNWKPECSLKGDCGPRVQRRVCECPEPAFGGKPCPANEPSVRDCKFRPDCPICQPAKDNNNRIICNGEQECGEHLSGYDSCGRLCTLPYIPCAPVCGDGYLTSEIGEVCDRLNVGESNCKDFGFLRSEGLRCNSTCDGFDTTRCADCSGNNFLVPGCAGLASYGRARIGEEKTVNCPNNCSGGPLKATCQSTGTFGLQSGSCVADSCPEYWTPDSSNPCSVLVKATVGQSFSKACEPWCTGGPVQATCNTGGVWSNKSGLCTQVNCPPIYVPGDVPQCDVTLNFTAYSQVQQKPCPPGCVGDRPGWDRIIGYCPVGGGFAYLAPWSGGSNRCIKIPTCSDLIQNQGETGVDCGGPCSACPTCFDVIQNQGEAGIDCGGPCPACAGCAELDEPTICGNVKLSAANHGQYITTGCPTGCEGDVSATCNNGNWNSLNNSCIERSCNSQTLFFKCSGIINFPAANSGENKTLPCGGTCTRGSLEGTCTRGGWLITASCASCSDGLRNTGETGIDCGGPCPACGTCTDLIINQGETGTDCGGPCPACSVCGIINDECNLGSTLIVLPDSPTEYIWACSTSTADYRCKLPKP